jgi:NAD(P)H-hydrate epimerase
VAEAAMEMSQNREIILLVGKGNKGRDAMAAGKYLQERGYLVRTIKTDAITKEIRFGDALIIDGLLGTGFKGKVEEPIGSAIRQANASGNPILAIDIPSGLHGTTGEIGGYAIEATVTVTLGLPKIGLFIRDGWNCVGKLRVADFGLPQKAIEAAKPVAFLANLKEMHLPKIVRNRHKYEAGYVLGLGGQAIRMSGLAALRAGAGIVRLFGKIENAAPALLVNKWDPKVWKTEMKRASAVFLGPSLGKTWPGDIDLPCVVDADALQPKRKYPKHSILTPHRGEVLRLLGLKETPDEEDLFARIMRFCERQNVYLVLKGAPTFIFAPEKMPVIVPFGDPGMATAGSGDVLTGIIAALLAQKMGRYEAALLGVTLHGLAGEAAAKEKTSYSMIATDIIEYLPKAFQKF